ncbi:ABC transporter permease [Leptolyngbya sp. FACHB-261]|uniref:ABC transporter permease n=1 Tax=Leptolyngbya sp. FACHB-261 TaxID=2692806 RepID=UPI0016834725|nr:ABC transporter permease [Leptolyngbya sp. FACHB-261]MBD2104041.1 ABC transporter permease [Leptolyngbya sp. FACHB-261]
MTQEVQPADNPPQGAQQGVALPIIPLSPSRKALQTLLRNPIAVVGGLILLLFILIALFAPPIAPYGYETTDLANRLSPPNSRHWFGTDDLGRDTFSRVVYGSRVSLQVGVFAVLGASALGTLLGSVAAYYGGWADLIISRVFDILLAFPSVLLAIAVVSALGPSLQNALAAIAIINVPTFGRLVRGQVLRVREEVYVQAARSIGMGDAGILFAHILPNTLAPILVQGSLSVATSILEAAALGFLGLGAQPPTPEWGKMLADSRQFIQQAPWTLIFPGGAIMLTVLGFNLVGDGLRDALDPRSQKR